MGSRGGISQLHENSILVSGKILSGFNNHFIKTSGIPLAINQMQQA
jgi:hypothetical protein